jgi:hypothetical protein
VEKRPWTKLANKPQDRKGRHCKLTPGPRSAAAAVVPEIMVDTNWWKSWAAERLTCQSGSDRAVVLFKADRFVHRMISEHWTSEIAENREGQAGNRMVEWIQPKSELDNEGWDCFVGTCVLGHIEGVAVDGPVRGVETNVRVQRRTRRKKKFVGF